MNQIRDEYDIGNRLIRSNDKKFSYDDDGNQIKAGDTRFDHMTSHVNGNNAKPLKSVNEDKNHVASYSYTLERLRTGKYLNSERYQLRKNVIYEKWSRIINLFYMYVYV